MVLSVLSLLLLARSASAANLKPTSPLMGWNSYNYYGCSPSEKIIKGNAQGLVDLGLRELGYTYVTPDCGWDANYRDASKQLVWNSSLFPSGGRALGDYLHNLGLKFGVYSGAGYYQCGSTDLPASLDYETIDANTFNSWGADSLKYDNCYAVSPTSMVDYTADLSASPTRFQTMARALSTTSRDIVYQVCQWGVGTDVGTWAADIAASWRISNDIQNDWNSIWRITNQVVPYFKHTQVGAYPDMDMLIVGLNKISTEEERFHFGMWAINKSPLILGCPTLPSLTPAESLEILSNKEVISLNQDPLGQQAQLVRRYTEEQWDIWAGNLSGSRLVVGLANWKNSSSRISVDLDAVLGVSSASARNVWASQNLGRVSGTYTTTLAGHELQLLVLSNIVASNTTLKSVGYYTAAEAILASPAAVTVCPDGGCLPSHKKVGYISGDASVTFNQVTVNSDGAKLLGVDFINYDVALESAWSGGTSSRNMTVSVNQGAAKRWDCPISGGDWFEAGRLLIEVEGLKAGSNTVVFRAHSGYAPDLVGIEVFET